MSIGSLRRLLAAPVFADEEQTRMAGLLHMILLSCLLGAAFFLFILLISPAYFSITQFMLGTAALILVVGGLVVLRRGHVRPISLTLVICLWVIITLASAPDAGVRDPAFNGYIIVILIGSLLLGIRAGIVLFVLSTAMGAAMLLLETQGLLPGSVHDYSSREIWIIQSIYFFCWPAALSQRRPQHSGGAATRSAERSGVDSRQPGLPRPQRLKPDPDSG
ncbi:MAG: hypothetical protein K8J31_30610 [Anaerolineae bacterium]|nr:hypothetical protein [Anaerolineae bacterium]